MASASLACAMLLPSGRANTRCSVCRFDPAGLQAQRGLAPGTGLRRAETASQIRGYRALARQQRPHARDLNPRKRPQNAPHLSETRKGRFVSECVVEDAVRIEPVSASRPPVLPCYLYFFSDKDLCLGPLGG